MLRMQSGRNARKQIGYATALLLFGAAFLAAAPAGALGLIGSGSGSGSFIGNAAGSLTGSGGSGSGSADASGAAQAAADAASNVEANPPDAQPYVDAAASAAMSAKAKAEAQANALLATKNRAAASGGAKWGIVGNGDGSYDVVLGGSYHGGLDGTLASQGSKSAKAHADVTGYEAAANKAKGKAVGTANGVIDTLAGLYSQLHASADVSLDGAAKAVGSIGLDIGGIFGLHQAANMLNTDSLHLGKHVDVAGPQIAWKHASVPDLKVPRVAMDQTGEVAGDATGTASTIVKS